jgi:undecaprenyl-diphosphatase
VEKFPRKVRTGDSRSRPETLAQLQREHRHWLQSVIHWSNRAPVTPIIALILGIVEGLTEYLPVSSTGHLTIAAHVLGVSKEQSDPFDVVIQFGAILAVVVHYRRLLLERVNGLIQGNAAAKNLSLCIAAAFVPTAIVGKAFHSTIRRLLVGPRPVAAALIVGGLFMIGYEIWRARRPSAQVSRELTTLDSLTWKQGFVIGCGQCASLWPGVSRSMATIVTGQLLGLSTQLAAEFSFLLGLPTLSAAALYSAYKDREVLGQVGALNVAIGLGVSFLVAWAVIAAFLRYLQKHGLAPFGAYRVVAGLATLWILAR